MRYADFAPPKPYARDPRPSEAALVVRPENIPDLLALMAERPDYALVERAQPGPDLPVMHYIRCFSALDAERLGRAWQNHIFERWRQRASSSTTPAGNGPKMSAQVDNSTSSTHAATASLAGP